MTHILFTGFLVAVPLEITISERLFAPLLQIGLILLILNGSARLIVLLRKRTNSQLAITQHRLFLANAVAVLILFLLKTLVDYLGWM